jgi:hypothetical protein
MKTNKQTKQYKRTHSKEESIRIRKLLEGYVFAASKQEQKQYAEALNQIDFFGE